MIEADLYDFYYELMQVQEDDFSVQINLLSIDGKAVAAQFAIKMQGTLSILKIAYDESMGSISPGSLLLNHIIDKEMQNEGTQKVSLVTCPLWCDRWHPQKTNINKLSLFNNTTAGKTMMRLDKLKIAAKSVINKHRQQNKFG